MSCSRYIEIRKSPQVAENGVGAKTVALLKREYSSIKTVIRKQWMAKKLIGYGDRDAYKVPGTEVRMPTIDNAFCSPNTRF